MVTTYLFPNNPVLTNYIEPLNWAPFFGLGVLSRKNDKIHDLFMKCGGIFSGIVMLLVVILCTISSRNIGYFSQGAYLVQLTGIFVLIYLSKLCFNLTIIKKIGQYSFSIYLFHLPFASILNVVFNHFMICDYFLLLKPLIVIAITFFLLLGMEFILKKNNKAKRLLRLIGR